MEGYSCKQGANRAAHNLARLALFVGADQIWYENFPSFVREIISVEQVQVMN
jgi:hypothetical protein